jgi:hypothetical protein
MAQKAQQAYLSVATAQGSTDVITGITNADPGVVSSTSHGNADGSIGIITGVVGMTQVNNRAFVVAATATSTFELKGVSTATAQGYGTYVSGGVWTPQTMTEVGEVRSISAFDGEDQEIDVTHLRSTGKEYLGGLAEFGSVQLTLWLPASVDTGQRKLRSLREVQSNAAFSITLPSGQIAAFVGAVKSFQITGIAVDGAVEASCSIKVSNQPAFFA